MTYKFDKHRYVNCISTDRSQIVESVLLGDLIGDGVCRVDFPIVDISLDDHVELVGHHFLLIATIFELAVGDRNSQDHQVKQSKKLP